MANFGDAVTIRDVNIQGNKKSILFKSIKGVWVRPKFKNRNVNFGRNVSGRPFDVIFEICDFHYSKMRNGRPLAMVPEERY